MTPAQDWLVVIDPQNIFANPDSPWGSPMWSAALPRIQALLDDHEPSRTIITRFVADPGLGGSWGPYYEEWTFALVPDADPLYAVVPELDLERRVAAGVQVVTAPTFGKWAEVAALCGPNPQLTLTGVSTDCCVLSTALPAADAGATVTLVADACAGSSPENHERALAAMALYAPQITVATNS